MILTGAKAHENLALLITGLKAGAPTSSELRSEEQ
jgi:hypothetical protein